MLVTWQCGMITAYTPITSRERTVGKHRQRTRIIRPRTVLLALLWSVVAGAMGALLAPIFPLLAYLIVG